MYTIIDIIAITIGIASAVICAVMAVKYIIEGVKQWK